VTEARAPGVVPTYWKQATVESVAHPMPGMVMLRLAVPDRIDHLPGQHYIVRLTAPDGYTAARSYSVSSAPSDPLLELCIERLPDGEVSGYLADVVEVGDQLDVRGPIGGWFVWDGSAPAVAIGGGTGVVPLVAMRRHAVDLGVTSRLKLAASGRSPAELPYADELMAAGARVAWTRGPTGRRLMPDDVAPLLVEDATYYVCGSAGFAEAMTTILVSLGVTDTQVRVERFGPSG
jgi:ferredoxin-NADP reductase